VAGLIALIVGVSATVAQAATLFSDDFQDGNATGWSKSGGEWSVVTDGTLAFRQTKLDSDLARQFAGDSTWTDYQVQARVKPLAYSSPTPFVGIAARSTGATTFSRLVLMPGNRAELQRVNSGAVTVLGSATVTTATGTYYTLRIEAQGSTVRGFVNNTQIGSGTSQSGNGRIGLQTFRSTASFDDVLVSTIGTPPPTTGPPPPTTTGPPPPTTPPPTTGPPPPPPGGLIGWATQGGGTTGGGSGPTVTVTSLSALTSAASSSTAQTIRVSGNFSCSADVRIASNKTILGVGSSSGLTGCGLAIVDTSNIIVRNMRIANVLAGNGNGDAIHIDHGTRIWIDHNDLSSNTSSGTDTFDGLLDCTHACDFVTVSWNNFHDHIKCSLVGHSDSNASEDTGHLRMTYHHNRFSNCQQRNPRVRFGNPVHVFNNYYLNIGSGDSYAIASTENAGVLIENNYFENVGDTYHLGEGSSDPGFIVARNNVFQNSPTGTAGGSVAGIPYSYTLESATNARTSVINGAGTGKIST
jgi:pectate lyase